MRRPRRRLAHNALTRGLLARKSPRQQIAVRAALAVESPSPLRSLAALMRALGTDQMGRALDGDDGKQIDGSAGFGDFDDGGESCKPSANHDDSGCCHYGTFQRSQFRVRSSQFLDTLNCLRRRREKQTQILRLTTPRPKKTPGFMCSDDKALGSP